MPSGIGHDVFPGLPHLLDKIQTTVLRASSLSVLFPNPWIRIAPETWPFRVQTEKNTRMNIEVWPESGRHDRVRWIRSLESGKPLANFIVSSEANGTVLLVLEYHITLHEQAHHSDASSDRAMAHILFQKQWSEDWKHIVSEPVNETQIAMCAMRKAQSLQSPEYLPGIGMSEKSRYVRNILGTTPGICEREPIAANALRILGE